MDSSYELIKVEYNKRIARLNAAIKFYEDDKKPMSEKKKWSKELNNIITDLEKIQEDFKSI